MASGTKSFEKVRLKTYNALVNYGRQIFNLM